MLYLRHFDVIQVRLFFIAFLLMFQLIGLSYARIIHVAVSTKSEPQVINGNPVKGIHVDIVNEALKMPGVHIEYHLIPFKHLNKAFDIFARKGKPLDAVVSVNGLTEHYLDPKTNEEKELYFSMPAVWYSNYAMSLKSQRLKIKNYTDLKGLSVVTFPFASIILGDQFKEKIRSFARYTETPEPRKAVAKLVSAEQSRTVVIWDKYSINYHLCRYIIRHQIPLGNLPKIQYSDIAPPFKYFVAFKDRALRDQFNLSYQKMIESKMIDKILSKYEYTTEQIKFLIQNNCVI